MKKLLLRLNMAIVAVMVATPAFAKVNDSGICALIHQMQDVFRLLRSLAFVGAAFIIAGWAWGYITKPGDLKLDDVKTKGTGMLVGFILLFSIGAILTAITTTAGQGVIRCVESGW